MVGWDSFGWVEWGWLEVGWVWLVPGGVDRCVGGRVCGGGAVWVVRRTVSILGRMERGRKSFCVFPAHTHTCIIPSGSCNDGQVLHLPWKPLLQVAQSQQGH